MGNNNIDDDLPCNLPYIVMSTAGYLLPFRVLH
jgi:hypothetical protein